MKAVHLEEIPEQGNMLEAEVALKAGCLLLSSGAEIWRVEETIHRILQGFGLEGEDTFVLSNGIFFTIEIRGKETYAKVRHIPISGPKLYMITEVNAVSRKIGAGELTPEEAMSRLEEIEKMKGKKTLTLAIAAFFGCASFSYLFGQILSDAIVSGISGMIVFLMTKWVSMSGREKSRSKLTLNIFGGLVAALSVNILNLFGFGSNIDIAMMGAIMPLIPGVALVTAVRDLANADYISGLIRLFDALLISFSISIGVYVAGVLIGYIQMV